MLSSRIKTVIASIISPPQSAFIPGRLIGDNILLAQALFRDYHTQSGPSRCAFKIDLRKAFDTLNWHFLRKVLTHFHFPEVFIEWIMKCVTGSMLSVKVNGAIEGYFNAGAGLRQGDPLSPYLFVMAMEMLTSCLKNRCDTADFSYHWHAKDLNITHITFADDILLFCHADTKSVDCLMAGLDDFSKCSRLKPNALKSQFFASNVDDDFRAYVLNSTGFAEGCLPVKYLGLPLISTKLSIRECMPLIMRIRAKMDSWLTCCLNQAGRLQLIKSVLYGIQQFWSSHFVLPKSVLKRLQSLFVKFLWGGSSDNSKYIKVSWADCCLPKDEGGLGLRDLCTWNTASFLFQLWRIAKDTDCSLWIMWFKRVYLKCNSLWTMNIPRKASWCIKKMLLLRPIALNFVKYQVGNASSFLFWLDPWVDNTPLSKSCHPSIISIAESTKMATVGQYISNSAWNLPSSNHLFMIELRSKISAITIHSRDALFWGNDTANNVKISSIWHLLRTTANSPAWVDAVWHTLAVPKCSFTLWLALKGRLLTKDRMNNFEMYTDLRCCLCNNALENHDHLFGSCPYIHEVMTDPAFNFTGNWSSYLQGRFFLNRPKGIRKLIGYLFIAASVYMVWGERNARFHDVGHSIPALVIRKQVKQLLREKLHSCKSFQQAAVKDNSLIMELY